MKAIVERVTQSSSALVAVDEIDITTDPELEAAYGLEIPVLMVDGKKAAKYRVAEEELRRLLTDRAGRAG
jgi:dsDNA-specific endonuclease/ATPase MutS2